MTPLEIMVAIHHATTGGMREFIPASPVSADIEHRMRTVGLLRLRQVREPGQSSYEPTPGLAVYLSALCAVSWPVQVWTMPEAQKVAHEQENSEVAP